MKRRFLVLLIVAVIMVAGTISQARAAEYKIDPVHSFVEFRIQHLGFSWMYGRFNSISGEFSHDPANLKANSITLEIDTYSVDTNHAERDKHLRSEDFLDIKKFPTATFKSTKYRGDAEAGVMEGILTMHGVSKPIKIDIKKVGEGQDPWKNYRAGFIGTVTINRRDFGIAGSERVLAVNPLKIAKDVNCWAIAILYLVLIWLGWYMVGLTFFDRWYHDSLMAHKSLGMIMLFLVLSRAAWILAVGTIGKFPLPVPFVKRYKRINFYFLMAIINITGYFISTSAGGSVKVFDFFNVPAIISVKKEALDFVIAAHYYLAYGSVLFILIHSLIKHRPRVLSRFKSK
jgi:polyisoprenoid-binding protein YceI/cytochrome b561